MRHIACAAAAAVFFAGVRAIEYFEHLGGDHTPGGSPSRARGLAPAAPAVGPGGRMLPPAGAPGFVNLFGLTLPTSVAFNAAGTDIYVAEKAGLVKLFHAWTGSGAGMALVTLDIRDRVTSWGDHGLTTVIVSETGPVPYLYATYMKRSPAYADNLCADHGQMDGRPMAAVNGCPIFGRFSRWPIGAGGALVAAEEEVILDTEFPATDADGVARGTACCQFSTHSTPVAVVEMGGYFYTSLGDGAAFTLVDAGQLGNNPCADNPGYLGAFRSQDPARLNGKILRWTPAAAAADWEFEVWTVGHRNPFRMSVDLPNNRILQTETGWYTAEEINVIRPEPSFKGTNMGWPCYEGAGEAPEYLNFYAQNPYCLTIAPNSTYFYTHPPGNAGNIASVSAVAAYAGRMYYADLSQQWIKSVPDTLAAPLNLADPLVQADVVTEMVNVEVVELKVTPAGSVIYVDHFPGIIHSLPQGEPLPSPAPPPPPPSAGIHCLSGRDWTPTSLAGSVTGVPSSPSSPFPTSVVVQGSSNVEGREGVVWTWSAVLLAGCADEEGAGDAAQIAADGGAADGGGSGGGNASFPLPSSPPSSSSCYSVLLAEFSGGPVFTIPVPSDDGTIEVRVRARTYGGVSASAIAYLPATTTRNVCTCPGGRVVVAAIPSATPSPSPSPARLAAAGGGGGNKPGAVDIKSVGFFAGTISAGAILGVALIAGGIYAGSRAGFFWAPASAAHGPRGGTPPRSSRLAASTAAGNTTSNERPLASNAAQRGPSAEAAAVAAGGGGPETRADRRNKAGFAPTRTGAAGADVPAYASPTATGNAAPVGARHL